MQGAWFGPCQGTRSCMLQLKPRAAKKKKEKKMVTQSIKAQTVFPPNHGVACSCGGCSLPSIQVQLLAQRACAVAVLINCPAQSCILCTCEHTIAQLSPLQVEENDICPIRTVNRITGRNPRELWMVHSKHSVKCPYLLSLAVIFFFWSSS